MDNEALLASWICTALMRIGTRMATGFDQFFAGMDITQSQFRILLSIQELGGQQGIAPSELAEALLIERGTISVLTNRMIEKGWLMRKYGKSRRTFSLLLTDTGSELLQRAVPRAIALADYTLASIPFEQQRQMRANLETIEGGLRNLKPIKE